MVPINTFCRDFQDIGALIAPRPVLIVENDRDPLNQIEGVRQLYTDIMEVYALYGLPRDISLAEAPGGHASVPASREKTFSFFVKTLMGKEMSLEEVGDSDRSPEVQLTAEDLRGYVDKLPENNLTSTIQDSFIQLARVPGIESKDHLIAFRDSLMISNNTQSFPVVNATGPEESFRHDNEKWKKFIVCPGNGWR
jgi:hypothetical protein